MRVKGTRSVWGRSAAGVSWPSRHNGGGQHYFRSRGVSGGLLGGGRVPVGYGRITKTEHTRGRVAGADAAQPDDDCADASPVSQRVNARLLRSTLFQPPRAADRYVHATEIAPNCRTLHISGQLGVNATGEFGPDAQT